MRELRTMMYGPSADDAQRLNGECEACRGISRKQSLPLRSRHAINHVRRPEVARPASSMRISTFCSRPKCCRDSRPLFSVRRGRHHTRSLRWR